MNQALVTEHISLSPSDHRRLNTLCGPLNTHIELIEKILKVKIQYRHDRFQIQGMPDALKSCIEALQKLYQQTETQGSFSTTHIQQLLHLKTDVDESSDGGADVIINSIHGVVKAKTPTQKKYLLALQEYDINFAVGPAGTGKTFLAVAAAVHSLQKEEVSRIVLVRPAVEAGEKLGFLPGDLSQKIDPYLRPLFDSLYDMLGGIKVAKLIESNVIEIAPLAYMRGRTLNDSYVILDEAQNTTREQMKMFLTRIGFGSKAIITGDITQVDLPKSVSSGLSHAIEVLKGIEAIKFTYFNSSDVIRHPLVQKIIHAYEEYTKE